MSIVEKFVPGKVNQSSP